MEVSHCFDTKPILFKLKHIENFIFNCAGKWPVLHFSYRRLWISFPS